MLAEFISWCNETITIKHADGTADRYGRRATPTSTANIKVYADRREQFVRTPEGYTIQAAMVLYCNSTTIDSEDIITYNGEDHQIASLYTVLDETGAIHHQEVALQ